MCVSSLSTSQTWALARPLSQGRSGSWLAHTGPSRTRTTFTRATSQLYWPKLHRHGSSPHRHSAFISFAGIFFGGGRREGVGFESTGTILYVNRVISLPWAESGSWGKALKERGIRVGSEAQSRILYKVTFSTMLVLKVFLVFFCFCFYSMFCIYYIIIVGSF